MVFYIGLYYSLMVTSFTANIYIGAFLGSLLWL